MKMGKDHLVPLTAPVIEILQRMRAFGTKGYVFLARRKANLQPTGARTWIAARGESENSQAAWVKPFQPHDIRRTAATFMRRLGYGLVVDRVLAHAPERYRQATTMSTTTRPRSG
jgi:integrase